MNKLLYKQANKLEFLKAEIQKRRNKGQIFNIFFEWVKIEFGKNIYKSSL